MIRRTRSKAAALETNFPIRVRVDWDNSTLPGIIQAIELWALQHLGYGRMVAYYGSRKNEALLYFRLLPDAQKCLDSFAETRLVDYADQDKSRFFTGGVSGWHSSSDVS